MCAIDWTAAAAWVQALGSIAAIVAAIVIGERQSERSRALVEDERRRQATIAAATLSNRLYGTQMEAVDKTKQLRALLAQLKPREPVNLGNGEKVYGMMHLTTADGLAAQHGSTMLFDAELGSIVGMTIDAVVSYNRTTLNAIRFADVTKWDTEKTQKFFGELIDRLERIASMTLTAESRLQPLHGFRDQETT